MFAFVQNDLGLIYVTRGIAEGPLEFMLDATANLLYGKKRWPDVGPIPWAAIAAGGGVLGYWLGGWRLAASGGWHLCLDRRDRAVEHRDANHVGDLAVAAPIAFLIGLLLGIRPGSTNGSTWRSSPF